MEDTTHARKEGTERRTESEKLDRLCQRVGHHVCAMSENIGAGYVDIGEELADDTHIQRTTVIDAFSRSLSSMEEIHDLVVDFSDFSEDEIRLLRCLQRTNGFVLRLLRNRATGRMFVPCSEQMHGLVADLDDALAELEREE